MDRERRNKLLMRSQNWLYVVLVLVLAGLAAWLSTRYVYEADWTANNRNSLSQPSIKLLAALDGPITITAYAREDAALRNAIRDFVARYQRVEPEIDLQFVNPDTDPAAVRELGITVGGTLAVAYGGGRELVTRLDEQALTNALARLARQGDSTVSFLTGHGERAPEGRANFDLGVFGEELKRLGISVETLNVAQDPGRLGQVQLLVIAGPGAAYLPGETALIQEYVEGGGNLLWLGEPGNSRQGLQPLAEMLGIAFLPGVVVDPTTRLFGIKDPAYALVVDYPNHDLTQGMQALTLYPQAAALSFNPDSGWETTPVLTTVARAWTETGAATGTIQFNEDSRERAGPLDIGLALRRDLPPGAPTATAQPSDGGQPGEQRVVVIGDGDFLSNSFLGNGANLELGVRVFNWLLGDDEFIEIAPKTAPDTSLQLTRMESAVIAVGSMIVLPLVLVIIGTVVWWRRRRR